LKQAVSRDLSLPEHGRFAGHFTYCLKTPDSRDWYRAIGLEAGTPSEGEHIHMGTSDCSLNLMSFLPERACHRLEDVNADPACIGAIRKIIGSFAADRNAS
tara:strand:- start:2002 stop:2304 length:303 start_codon:yes stop_codon:yes gene_type:complete